jgi:hypothetical protein
MVWVGQKNTEHPNILALTMENKAAFKTGGSAATAIDV